MFCSPPFACANSGLSPSFATERGPVCVGAVDRVSVERVLRVPVLPVLRVLDDVVEDVVDEEADVDV
ncbi:hypothetical protein GCM10023192_71540 [Amycolatopsis samaneae]